MLVVFLVGLAVLSGGTSGCQFASDITPQSITRSLAYPAPVAWGHNSKEQEVVQVRKYRPGDWDTKKHNNAANGQSSYGSPTVSDPLFVIEDDETAIEGRSTQKFTRELNVEKAQKKAYQRQLQQMEAANRIHTDFRRQERLNKKSLNQVPEIEKESSNPFLSTGETSGKKIFNDYRLFQEDSDAKSVVPKLPPAPTRFQASVNRIAEILPANTPFRPRN